MSESLETVQNPTQFDENFNGEGEETAASMQEKKHAEMLKHLADLNNARLLQSQSRKTQTLSAPTFESVHIFLNRFSQTRQKIHKSLDEFLEKGNSQDFFLIKSGLETLSCQISDLEKLVAENSYFLPSYEVRAASNGVAELKERLEKTNSQLLPKKKFAFRNKISRSNPNPNPNPRESEQNPNPNHRGSEQNPIPNPRESEQNPNPNEFGMIHEKSCSFALDAPGIGNKEGLVVVKDLDASTDGDFALSDLVNCKVYLKGRLRALFIHRLKGCQVFAGPVMGSVLIEEAENCVFMLASHQIRIHQSVNTDFYLRVRSRPIVEYVSNVRFAPYALVYRGIEEELQNSDLNDETGMWANVDDFRWLRAVSSPNWSIIPEDDRLPLVDISDLKAEGKTVS